MKKALSFYHQFLFLALMPTVAFSANGQPQFIQVASRANSYCNSTCTQLDIPELNENTAAIVFASPLVENGLNQNPHPIGVHFINHKWSIINLDQTSMPAGSKFSVQYFSTPDPAYQFVHTVSLDNLKENNTRSYIDHPGINNNPEAQIQFIPSGIRGGFNLVNLAIQYDTDAGKWYLFNGGKTVDHNTAVNIVIGTNEKPVRASNSNAIVAKSVNTTRAAFGKVQLIMMTVESTTGVFFTGESTTANKTEIRDFNFEIAMGREVATGQASGRRQYQPIVVTKFFGASSLQFYKAVSTNASLKTVTLEYYSSEHGGPPVLVNTMKLTNARVTAYKHSIITDPASGTGPKGLLDEIKFVFQSLELKDASGLIITDTMTGVN